MEEIRWEGSGTLESGNFTLLYGECNVNHQLGTVFFLVHRRIRLAVKWMEFISDIVLNIAFMKE